MPMIKCKMCGGDLILIEGSTVCECEYCGTKQTVPSADNEKKLTLFNRAGRLLRACEFDKAAGVFETIVADFPQEAEAYWGLVLCKYGIEYVDDPATGKKIPTCHRSSFDSVLDDANFEQACENTDAVARRVYRDEARQIEELRQAILQVSGKEEPYDVFISYKETDANGERTLDSVIAQDIYKELTNEGYRVFFSRISLEDKLGAEYEPYIFAALNSAKVMLVVGTDYENFDAVWVKNEWSRFLKLIARGEKKTLIPVFKNMDAYDMPKEFARLAAQDMGKVGAMQDLMRGVEKIVGKKKAEPVQAQPVQQVVQQTVVQGGGPNVTAMVERGHQALEDGEWTKADEFFDQALNMDAKCAEAFLGKFLAQEKAVSLDAALDQRLAECDRNVIVETKRVASNKSVEQMVNANSIPGYISTFALEKAFLFDTSYSSTAEYFLEKAKEEKNSICADRLYVRAERYATGELSDSILRSFKRFEDALDQKAQIASDSAAKAKQEKEAAYAVYMERAEKAVAEMRREAEARREHDYQKICAQKENANSIAEYEAVAVKLKSTGMATYKDSAKLADECHKAIIELEEKERAEKEEAERQRIAAEAKAAAEEAERQRIEREKKEANIKKRQQTLRIILAASTFVLIAIFLIISKIILPSTRYEKALALYEGQAYEEALPLLNKLGNYKDSVAMSENIRRILFQRMIEAAAVGDTITFGSYEQDDKASNGKESIEWLVLAKKEDRLLIVSRYALDCQPFSTNRGNVNWENSFLRKWLNESFLENAFSPEEQEMILLEPVTAEANYLNSGDPGKDTQDKVFLLSNSEAYTYFSSRNLLKCEPTALARAHGVYMTSTVYCWWYLRSQGYASDAASGVDTGGYVRDNLDAFEGVVGGTRPAMWIKLG